MLQLVHVVEHFGGEVGFPVCLLGVGAEFGFQVIGLLACDCCWNTSLFKGFASTRVDPLILVLLVHSAVEDVVPIFNAKPGVLLDI